MDRRNFVKLVGTASGGVLSGACGTQSRELIPLLVPEEGIEPGVEAWHPSVCQECGAGCGTLARVMAAEREIELDGERVRQRIAAVKKLEGNPLDPVSGGRLCARGQAALQSLYSPDRLRGPLKRSGERGQGRFEPVSWDAAMEEAAAALKRAAEDPSRILFLARPRATARSLAISRFLEAVGAPPACSVGSGDFAAERAGAQRAFGWNTLPVYDIQDSTYVLSIGADFLGGWVSPVLYTRRYGAMRQGRPGIRGRLTHGESRFSLTAWSADRWLPVWPGGEAALALAVGHLMVLEKLAPALDRVPEQVLEAFASVDLDQAAQAAAIPPARIRDIAEELAGATAPVVLAGASMVRPNSADAVTAASALNLLLGSVGREGGVRPSPRAAPALEASRPASASWMRRLEEAELVLVDGVDPAYTAPFSRSMLTGVGTLISFSPFLDDSAAYADLILPDCDPLEVPGLVVPDAAPVPAVSAAAAFVGPLHDTRPTEDVLSALAEAAGKPGGENQGPGALQEVYASLGMDPEETSAEQFAAEALRRGGWQGPRAGAAGAVTASRLGSLELGERLEGLLFQAYPSLQFGDGSGANRPWLQELPDPASSAMWGLPVELDPGTAASLGVASGDGVRVESRHGSLTAAVYVNPTAIPGVASMAVGLGHRHFGEFAAGRGANPLELLPASADPATGATALGPVAVTIVPTGTRERFVQFSRQDRDPPPQRL